MQAMPVPDIQGKDCENQDHKRKYIFQLKNVCDCRLFHERCYQVAVIRREKNVILMCFVPRNYTEKMKRRCTRTAVARVV